MQVIRWFAVLALSGGAIAVINSVFSITPETANGRGSIPLVTNGTVWLLATSWPARRRESRERFPGWSRLVRQGT